MTFCVTWFRQPLWVVCVLESHTQSHLNRIHTSRIHCHSVSRKLESTRCVTCLSGNERLSGFTEIQKCRIFARSSLFYSKRYKSAISSGWFWLTRDAHAAYHTRKQRWGASRAIRREKQSQLLWARTIGSRPFDPNICPGLLPRFSQLSATQKEKSGTQKDEPWKRRELILFTNSNNKMWLIPYCQPNS